MTIYHAHIYFSLDRTDEAKKLRELSVEKWSDKVLGISKLISRPIGPHPVPMFEIDFPETILQDMKQWLETHRGDLSVLIHRNQEPELVEHTTHAIWLGQRLKLDLSVLDQ